MPEEGQATLLYERGRLFVMDMRGEGAAAWNECGSGKLRLVRTAESDLLVQLINRRTKRVSEQLLMDLTRRLRPPVAPGQATRDGHDARSWLFMARSLLDLEREVEPHQYAVRFKVSDCARRFAQHVGEHQRALVEEGRLVMPPTPAREEGDRTMGIPSMSLSNFSVISETSSVNHDESGAEDDSLPFFSPRSVDHHGDSQGGGGEGEEGGFSSLQSTPRRPLVPSAPLTPIEESPVQPPPPSAEAPLERKVQEDEDDGTSAAVHPDGDAVVTSKDVVFATNGDGHAASAMAGAGEAGIAEEDGDEEDDIVEEEKERHRPSVEDLDMSARLWLPLDARAALESREIALSWESRCGPGHTRLAGPELQALILQRLDSASGETVLLVDESIGAVASALRAKLGARVIACCPTEVARDLSAVRSLASRAPELEFHVAAASDAVSACGAEAADAVLVWDALSREEDKAEALRALLEAARPCAQLLLAEWSVDGSAREAARLTARAGQAGLSLADVEEWEEALFRAGWAGVACEDASATLLQLWEGRGGDEPAEAALRGWVRSGALRWCLWTAHRPTAAEAQAEAQAEEGEEAEGEGEEDEHMEQEEEGDGAEDAVEAEAEPAEAPVSSAAPPTTPSPPAYAPPALGSPLVGALPDRWARRHSVFWPCFFARADGASFLSSLMRPQPHN